MTGPAGATYTINDGVASYGTVANSVSAPCTDCYTVSVSNPPTRPAMHWDASAVESITPDTQGQQKRWTLHVGESFTDVPTSEPVLSLHRDAARTTAITGGCTADAVLPGQPDDPRADGRVRARGQGRDTGYVPPACTTPVFADVPASSPFCRWIEELARRGVVGGCGGGNYCPTSRSPASRWRSSCCARWIRRSTRRRARRPVYADVPATSGFCRWIEELTRRGVVTGCGGGNYCPTAPVTREQMGVFISVTFGLTLYGP